MDYSKLITEFQENFPTKEQVLGSVHEGKEGWGFSTYFDEKLGELLSKVAKDTIDRCLNEIPDELPMVDEKWTYGDTDYQSNAVRSGVNECRETAINRIEGLKKTV